MVSVFTRVAFGISSSPFLLNATVDHYLKLFSSTNPELVEVLLRSIYVDDVVAGAVDVDAAFKLYKESKRVLQEGGFNLRKFTSQPMCRNFRGLSTNRRSFHSTLPPPVLIILMR